MHMFYCVTSYLQIILSTSLTRTNIIQADGEGPGWAPLRDNYMLTNSKLKDWDKMKVTIPPSPLSLSLGLSNWQFFLLFPCIDVL